MSNYEDGPSSVRTIEYDDPYEKTGKGVDAVRPKSVHVYLDQLEKELAIYAEQITRLEDRAHTLLLPEYPDTIEKSFPQEVAETSPVGSRILNLVSALAKQNRSLIDIISRIET